MTKQTVKTSARIADSTPPNDRLSTPAECEAAALLSFAQTARRNAAACLTLADRMFRQGNRDAAERLVKLAEDCRSIARRAESIGQ